MKPHRVFIAVDLPENIKRELLSYQTQWKELPARWAKPENLHFTLAFIGNTSDTELEQIKTLLAKEAEQHTSFPIQLERIAYGPNEANPKMIWATFVSSQDLKNLQKGVEQTLSEAKLYTPQPDSFLPHITLAKLAQWQFQRMEPEERPTVDQEINLAVFAQSIEIMESKTKQSGTEYSRISNIALGDS